MSIGTLLYGAIPCFGSLGFVMLLFGFILAMRYMNYRETLALADKGLVRPERPQGNGKGALRWGIIITALGLAVSTPMAALIILDLSTRSSAGPLDVPRLSAFIVPATLFGLIPLFFGIALILIYVLTREKKQKGEAEKQD